MAYILEQLLMRELVDESIELINRNTISILCRSIEDNETITIYDTEVGSGITIGKGQSVTLTASAGNVLPAITIEPTIGTGIFEIITQ
jgi:hypothetical protein